MGDYIPCRTDGDVDAHLYAAGEPERALCGKRVDRPTNSPGDGGICMTCGVRLLTRVYRQAGPGGVTSIQVTVR